MNASITKRKNGSYNVKVSVVEFREEDTYIIYCPALDLSGYGESDTEAKKSFEIVLHEYIRYADNKGTLNDDLIAHGWKKRGKTTSMVPPSMTQLLTSNENFSRIFNKQPSYQKYDMPVEVAI